MKRLSVPIVALLVVASLALLGCSQSAPTPTAAPAAPKAAEPTKAAAPAAPAAQPTAAPAKKVEWPAKGKAVMLLVPYGAGGTTDIAARVLAPLLSKELGVPVEVVNKPEGGTQVALTELAKAKPDGYTIGYTPLPGTATIVLDTERKAAFTRKDFQAVALHVSNPEVVGVKADSPYKTMKDLIDAAKANPGKLKVSTAAPLGDGHLGILQLEKSADIRLGVVNMEGGGQAITALLGGHVDICIQSLPNFAAQVKGGEIRVLGIMDKEGSKFLPAVKTLDEQGYRNVYMSSVQGISVPAATPKEVVDVLGAAIKKTIASDEHSKKLDGMSVAARYMDASQYSAYWDEMQEQVKPLMELAKQQQ